MTKDLYFAARPASAPSRAIQEQDNLSLTIPLSGLERSDRKDGKQDLVNTLLPLQQLDVGTSFIGGGDQGYIACP